MTLISDLLQELVDDDEHSVLFPRFTCVET